jgi:hypothetical protein
MAAKSAPGYTVMFRSVLAHFLFLGGFGSDHGIGGRVSGRVSRFLRFRVGGPQTRMCSVYLLCAFSMHSCGSRPRMPSSRQSLCYSHAHTRLSCTLNGPLSSQLGSPCTSRWNIPEFKLTVCPAKRCRGFVWNLPHHPAAKPHAKGRLFSWRTTHTATHCHRNQRPCNQIQGRRYDGCRQPRCAAGFTRILICTNEFV